MNTTPELLENIFDPDEMDAFVQRGLFRAPEWSVRSILGTGGTPEDPKFTKHDIGFRGPNWSGHVTITIVGKAWRTSPEVKWYTIAVFVHRLDGPTMMVSDEFWEVVTKLSDEIKYNRKAELPEPTALYPYIEAALDEHQEDFVNFRVSSRADAVKIGTTIGASILHYLKGANVVSESAEFEESYDTVVKQRIDEAAFDQDDLDDVAQSAIDAGAISLWKKAQGANHGKYMDVWAIDVKIPDKFDNYTGHIVFYTGSENMWILHLYLDSGGEDRKFIVGYLKNEPTPALLDKIRTAAVEYTRTFNPATTNGKRKNPYIVVSELSRAIQNAITGDPEVYMLNYDEKLDEGLPVGDFMDDFMDYSGIGQWENENIIQGDDVKVHSALVLRFKFDDLVGSVQFRHFTYVDTRQNVSLYFTDASTGEKFVAVAESTWNQKFCVPPDQIDDFKSAMRTFVAKKLKPLSAKARARKNTSVLPTYGRKINALFLEAVAPWYNFTEGLQRAVKESLADEIGAEFLAHGGAPLEWRESSYSTGKDATWVLKFPWLDGSHIGVIGLQPLREFGSNLYAVQFTATQRDEDSEGLYDREAITVKATAVIRPEWMPKFHDLSVELAKKLMREYGANRRIMPENCVTEEPGGKMRSHRDDFTYIQRELNKILNSHTLSEGLDPGEFLSDFDIEGVMSPWEKHDHTDTESNYPKIVWTTDIIYKDTTRPFNDKAYLMVTHWLPHGTVPIGHSVIIDGSFSYKGSGMVELSSIRVPGATGEVVRDIVDTVARRLLLPKIAKNRATPGGWPYFRRSLINALKANGLTVESTCTEPAEPPILEAIEGLVFRSECRGAHSGQSDMTLYAELNGNAVGRIEYCVFDGEVYVQYIKTQPAYVRRGVATALAKKLQSEYPDTEIVWSGATDQGAPFINSLNREFEPTPNYAVLKKAYDDAKAERDGLQAEFDAYFATGKSPMPKSMLMKGERMNELEMFLWDMEDRLRDLKPGRWMIREAIDPDVFLRDFEREEAVPGWSETGFHTILTVNKSGILGQVFFASTFRPMNSADNDAIGRTYRVSLWANRINSPSFQQAHECPDLHVRLSSTPGVPSFQPGTVDQFKADYLEANRKAVSNGCMMGNLREIAEKMFTYVYRYMKGNKWAIDVDKNGRSWDLVGTSVGEALDWSPDEIGDLAAKATSLTMDWQSSPYEADNGFGKGIDWTLHIHAPYGQLSEQNNYVRIRFYEPRPEDGAVLAHLDLHLASPRIVTTASGEPYVAFYDHVNCDKQLIVTPDQIEDVKKGVESQIRRILEPSVLRGQPAAFNLNSHKLKIKQAFTKLQRQFWIPGKVWI